MHLYLTVDVPIVGCYCYSGGLALLVQAFLLSFRLIPYLMMFYVLD